MKLYGRRFVKNYVDRRVRLKTETRDAIVWDIDWENYVAKVKIQGSNEYVMAHFPRNWKVKPYWLKKGNAVSIRHREGVKGYIEVTGEGRAIPTAIEGSSMPEPDSEPDMILSGLVVSETEPESMGVWVTAGSYRIGGVVYYVFPEVGDYIVMNDPAPMAMSATNDELMGGGIATVELDPAPAEGYYRYDLLVVGTDSQIDYIAGTPHRTNPQFPAIPEDHLQIGDYILVAWNMTYVDNGNIGAVFTSLSPSSLEVTASGSHISGEMYFEYVASGEYGYPDPECYINVAIYDQYGLSLTINGTLELEMVNGTGDVYSGDDGWGSSVSQAIYGNNYNFKYRRDETTTERSVAFQATLSIVAKELVAGGFVTLLDGSDAPIQF